MLEAQRAARRDFRKIARELASDGEAETAEVINLADALVSSPAWREWRQQALERLSPDAVYGDLLTGRRRSQGWLECRDPGSPSGDRHPSASVADGTGIAERDTFYSFRGCRSLSVFDFLIEYRGCVDFRAACAEVARLSGVAPPRAAETNSTAREGTPVRFPLTDTGNAERLIAHFGAAVRYCHTWGAWIVWDGKRWRRDGTAELMRLAKQTARRMTEEFRAHANAVEGTSAPIDDYYVALEKHARKSESAEKRRAMAANEAVVSTEAEHLDASPWLLNVENGTVDLRTGTLSEHDQAALLTRLVSIRYDPGARCSGWLQFLTEIFLGNEELISFMQRAVGYSLTGITREQKFFLCHGNGENGKSIYLKVLAKLLGEYALAADFDTFASADAAPGAPRPDLVRLRGARVVTAAEPDQRVHLSESRLKLITGEDIVVARNLHEHEQEFRPILKLWLMANHRPTVTESNHGFWRRVQLIPFDYRVPADQKDPQLGEKLQGELQGILVWAVQGCLEWQRVGLGVAKAVTDATDAYRSEMDVVGRFIDDACVMAPETETSKAVFYAAYQKWCAEADEKPFSSKSFTLKLRERGLKDGRSNRARCWKGIGLRGTTKS